MAGRSGPSQGGSTRGRPSKRHHPAVFNGIGGSAEDRNNDYLCPICFDLIEEAHITRCGHTFCFSCIRRSLDASSRCPKCGSPIPDLDHLFPNFLLNELVSKYRQRTGVSGRAMQGVGDNTDSTLEGGLRDFVASESRRLSLPDVNALLEVLTQRKHLLEAESCAAQNRLLHEFLRHLLRQKEEQLAQLGREVALVRKDLAQVEAILRDVQEKCPKVCDGAIEGSSTQGEQQKERLITDTVALPDKPIKTEPGEMSTEPVGSTVNSAAGSSDGFNGSAKGDPASLAARRKRMHAHFDDFVQCYFASRAKELMFGPTIVSEPEKSTSEGLSSGTSAGSEGLDLFRENLVKFSRYSTLRPLATLNYSSDIFNNSTIVSSIEFDKDNEFFAIAGVTKRIKVFEYGTVVRDAVDIHYPCVEMVSGSKISCVSWNAYHKGTLASSDYEGAVTIWDAGTGSRVRCFQEHERRCWSVDFNRVDARLVASGSDDARVKLWSLNAERSITSLEAKANVCCVKFNPRSSCHLAFGSADHCVHYYDLRHVREPLAVFRGHRKAVSYVKFLNREEIVSASTDSQLKMWSVGMIGGSSASKTTAAAPSCLRSFVGHLNEKNFVGLATDGDYVACGSENNALYVYYKGLSKQLFSFKFDAVRSVLEKDRKEDDVNEFVSAVCWRQNSNVVVAANSQGIIKVLESGPPLKKGKSRIFFDLDDCYSSVAVVGLGKHPSATKVDENERIDAAKENVRIGASAGCRSLKELEVDVIDLEDFGCQTEAAAEGATLGLWTYRGYRNPAKQKNIPELCPHGNVDNKSWGRGIIKATAQNFARNMADTPGNCMTPTIFAKTACEELSKNCVAVEIRDKEWAECMKMGSFLSVAKGSCEPPLFLEINYTGRPDCANPIVLVGKGVTFDSGGISIKNSKKMDEMRADMGGAACVVATINAVASLRLPVNIIGLIPLCENMPSGSANKPGDVVFAMNGKSIIVDNTDAEGRLILADALCYAQKFNPQFTVDIATLTGAIRVALGSGASGVFTNSNCLWEKLECAGATTGDRVWRLPLWKHYSKEMTEVAGADLNNLGKGMAGSCTAAAFLKEFIPSGDWMHLDIAGVMSSTGESPPYISKGMSGRPTRTLIEFLSQISCQ